MRPLALSHEGEELDFADVQDADAVCRCANVLGNGRWFESMVTNLLPPGLPQQNTTRLPNKQVLQNNGGTEATG